ncbi:MAG: hypothetical protein ACJAXX_001312 [Roseivirga sp.]|jgi:hypothetical protein
MSATFLLSAYPLVLLASFCFYDKGYPDNKKRLEKADSIYSITEKRSPDYRDGHYQRALVKFQLGE